MFAYEADSENTISLAQKTIEALAEHSTGAAKLPEGVKKKVSNVVIETQAIIGMIASGLEVEENIALLENYHAKNTALLSDINKYLEHKG
ncbi:hypothetical protein [Aeromonas hydrophila]|uniref:hypothetical protein n=1 Tax=Aeromonas hydrophila TaxID=644 RepID=UPI002250DBF8|nr:hypothetical protein [Aeromonas hydrophila]MCX4116354.1 hypothetical protein [Aeromonas hydrophila]